MSIPSPCIRNCLLDEEAGICEGCGRTLDEIVVWSRMRPEERESVMAALPARLETLAMKTTERHSPTALSAPLAV